MVARERQTNDLTEAQDQPGYDYSYPGNCAPTFAILGDAAMGSGNVRGRNLLNLKNIGVEANSKCRI